MDSASVMLKDRYRIVKTIKSGGMGRVYLAEDIPERKLRAIKVMFNQGEASEQQLYAIKRFREEAEILARLDHPNIPSITDYFIDKGSYYLVMDYIKGEDLESLLRKCNFQIPEKFVVLCGIQLCDVLSYLHTHKTHPILYRDLKPANIILKSEENRIFLIDFGIARVIKPSSDTQKTAVGTEGYAPLEQYKGQPEPRSDVYALGATMHHLLTGITPIPFSFQSIRHIRDWLSRELEKIVMKALENEIDKRFLSAKEMKEELLKFCREAYPDMYEILQQPLKTEKAELVTLDRVEAGITQSTKKPLPSHRSIQNYHKHVPPHYGHVPPYYGHVPPHYGHVPPHYGHVPPHYGQSPYPYGYPHYSRVPYGHPSSYSQITPQGYEKQMSPSQISSAFSQATLGQRTIFNQVVSPHDETSIYEQVTISDMTYDNKSSSWPLKEAKDEIEKLIYMLRSNDIQERSQASSEIVQSNIQDNRLLEPMIYLLNDLDWNIRREMATALGNQGNKKAIQPLLKKLKDEQPDVRISVIEALAKIGDGKVAQNLIEVLNNDLDEGVRVQTIITMGEIGNDITIPSLIGALKDNSAGVRKTAAQVLGQFKDHRALPHLEKAMRDPSNSVAFAAKKSFDRLKAIL
ncbi:MAG TPA: HEAT repeat domain-containing protein [Candidatus Eremiobacteraeota bacterium]|nr:HEAT repeat domain-containing protein [Candidatus Eremiobacteraeota bacterium]